ncbi:hypothetical protein HYD49_03860 [Mycoplasmopsis bovis]|nr:hypothetical protein [Mycoplasmopsis bovis]QQH72876.1 hypothetical protein HYD49_03860 [Mycoplasmopsis bovis]
MKQLIKEAIVTKVPTLKDKELNLNADLSKKSVTVSAKGFEGEVTLKFEIETQISGKSKWWNEIGEKIKQNLTKNQKRNWRYTNWRRKKLIDKNLYNGLTQDENHIWGKMMI